MNLSKLIIFLLAFNTYAVDSLCLSHAQCQNIIEDSTACFLVKNEMQDDREGSGPNCSTRCFDIQIGSYCHFEEGQSFGTCRDEDYKKTQPVPSKKSCKNAIPTKVINDLYNL